MPIGQRHALIMKIVEDERAAARHSVEDEIPHVIEQFSRAGATNGSDIQKRLLQIDLRVAERVLRARVRAERDEPFTPEEDTGEALAEAERDVERMLEEERAWLEQRGREREIR
jgi:hypothetical protein